MNRSDAAQKRGRGTENPPFSTEAGIKSEGRDLILGERDFGGSPVPRPLPPSDSRDALAAFLALNPAMTVRDFKGKGFGPFAPFDPAHVERGEKPWHKLDRREVRALAITYPARFLSKSVRQAAARDPGLAWEELTRRYFLTGSIDD